MWKKLYCLLFYAVFSLAGIAQNNRVETVPAGRYILYDGGSNYSRETWGSLFLDTRTGDIKVLYPDGNAEKVKLEDFTGGPHVNPELSYNGRFSVADFSNGRFSFFILYDKETGEMWHGKKRQLIKIN